MPYPAREYAVMFHRHRAPLVDLLDKVPAEKGNIPSWEGGRTVRELVDHLYSTGEGLVSMLAGGRWEAQPDSATLPEATARLRANTQTIMDRVSGLSESDMQREVTVFGGARWPVYRLIDFHREHEVHHKGQLWAMVRELGLEPPFFMQMT